MPRWPLGALIHVSRIVISVDALVSRSVCALRSAERCAADDDAARFDTAISVSNKSGWLVLDARAVVLIVGVQRFGLHAAAVASRRPLRCLHDLRAAVSLVAVDAPLPRLWRALLPRVPSHRVASTDEREPLRVCDRCAFSATHPEHLGCERPLACPRCSPPRNASQCWIYLTLFCRLVACCALCPLWDKRKLEKEMAAATTSARGVGSAGPLQRKHFGRPLEGTDAD